MYFHDYKLNNVNTVDFVTDFTVLHQVLMCIKAIVDVVAKRKISVHIPAYHAF